MSFRSPQYAQPHDSMSEHLNLMNGPPPPYEKVATQRPWHPRQWSRRTKIWAILSTVALLIIIIVVAVVESRNNRYPSYTPINYTLLDTYSGSSFFDNFDYFTGYDPSQGFVHYVDQVGSEQLNLTYATSSSATIRVDLSNIDASQGGRKSVRIESKSQYNEGLFIFDILHTPYGCGTWPALWLTDPTNWPTNGEIDVVEAVNQATSGNQVTLHTTKDCTMNVKRKESGKVLTANCLNSTDDNAGCGVQGAQDTYGQALNENGGGVYAMELRSAGIRTWFFPRSSIPSDISSISSTPNPSSWGTALADFPSTDCSISNHFRNQSIIANIDLCGEWAGLESVYTTQDDCPGTCENLVSTNATAFANAYWEFASFRVYQPAN